MSAYSTPSPSSTGSSSSMAYPMSGLSLSHHPHAGTSGGAVYSNEELPANKRHRSTQPLSTTTPSGPAGAWPPSSHYPGQGSSGSGGTPYPQASGTMGSSGYSQTEIRHGPTELPPRPYARGDPSYGARRPAGKIPESAMGYVSQYTLQLGLSSSHSVAQLPILEQRFGALEGAVDGYVNHIGQQALKRSVLPGSDQDPSKTRSGSGSSGGGGSSKA
jgi:hypothetical protein